MSFFGLRDVLRDAIKARGAVTSATVLPDTWDRSESDEAAAPPSAIRRLEGGVGVDRRAVPAARELKWAGCFVGIHRGRCY